MPLISLQAGNRLPIPDWALRQRHLIEVMNEAAPLFQARYTRPDGTLVWREDWPGMDGSDDGYESYHNWPRFEMVLPPGRQTTLKLGMHRYCHTPSYEQPEL